MLEGTYYRWNAKYGGMDVNAARRLKELELEKRRLKAALADVTLDKQALPGAGDLHQRVLRVAQTSAESSSPRGCSVAGADRDDPRR